ncbi:transposase [Aliifodinibius salicampi]|uniref:Transposase n=1 Tax=Fodinibius salicampi TaxID=1920655 RepID=A0ABT3Q015_9BACT|nr:hypothetical protein [Fodinibius salicampi]MCW9713420.1 transposase [Fodinibius salicampi]
MPNEGNKYTPEFKKKIAQKALENEKQNLEQLSDQYDIPVSVILMWATELEKGGEEAFKEASDTESTAQKDKLKEADVDISDEELTDSMQHGVMYDKLNYKRLTFWSVLGIILVLVFVQALFEMYQYHMDTTQLRVSSESEFYQAKELKENAEEKLNTFGVVDLEEGTYRVPIDSVINEMAVNEE